MFDRAETFGLTMKRNQDPALAEDEALDVVQRRVGPDLVVSVPLAGLWKSGVARIGTEHFVEARRDERATP